MLLKHISKTRSFLMLYKYPQYNTYPLHFNMPWSIRKKPQDEVNTYFSACSLVDFFFPIKFYSSIECLCD